MNHIFNFEKAYLAETAHVQQLWSWSYYTSCDTVASCSGPSPLLFAVCLHPVPAPPCCLFTVNKGQRHETFLLTQCFIKQTLHNYGFLGFYLVIIFRLLVALYVVWIPSYVNQLHNKPHKQFTYLKSLKCSKIDWSSWSNFEITFLHVIVMYCLILL